MGSGRSAVVTAAIGTLLLGGCASVLGAVEESSPGGPGNGGAGGEAATCVDWVLHATPFDGVVTPGPDGGLPASWPAGHPGL